MEGLIIFALGAGAVLVAQRGRKQAKDAVGWIARQSGWLVGRIRTDIDAARKIARDEFSRARSANPPPMPDDVVPSARVHHAESNAESNGRAHSE
jgi:hypothetical protein